MSAKDMEIDAVKNQKQKEIVSFIIIPKNIKKRKLLSSFLYLYKSFCNFFKGPSNILFTFIFGFG